MSDKHQRVPRGQEYSLVDPEDTDKNELSRLLGQELVRRPGSERISELTVMDTFAAD